MVSNPSFLVVFQRPRIELHRVISFDFDTTDSTFCEEILPAWEPEVRRLHEQDRGRVRERFVEGYGTFQADIKGRNSVGFGNNPMSVLADHNALIRQVRDAFMMGACYFALTGASPLFSPAYERPRGAGES